jgi:hypothetical protein
VELCRADFAKFERAVSQKQVLWCTLSGTQKAAGNMPKRPVFCSRKCVHLFADITLF